MSPNIDWVTVAHEDQLWVQFSKVLGLAGGLDPDEAASKCRVAGIPRISIPGKDSRVKYIRVEDVPVFLRQYTRPNPAIADMLQRLTGETLNAHPDNIPGVIPGNSSNKPGNYPINPGKAKQLTPVDLPVRWWETAGVFIGDFYASHFFAYMGLTGMSIAQGIIHSAGAIHALPQIDPWQIMPFTILVQVMIITATVSGSFFKDDSQYRWFLMGFAVYDGLMNGCNFFRDFDPTLLGHTVYNAGSWHFVTWSEKIQAITNLGTRIGLTAGFPLGTVFFASLVKKIRTIISL